jgi:hypothetical protein
VALIYARFQGPVERKVDPLTEEAEEMLAEEQRTRQQDS